VSRLDVHVNLLWCAPGRVGGSEEYLVRQLTALRRAEVPVADIDLTVHLGTSLAAARPELAESGADLRTTRLDVDRRSVRIPVEHTALAWRTRRADVVHHGGGTIPFVRPPVPTVLTVHDLQYRRFPHYFPAGRLAYLRAMMPRSARAASVVATPSAHVAADVVDAFGIDPARTIVVPHPIETPVPDELLVAEARRCHVGAGRLFVFPAITHPHKGHIRLLEAMAHHWPDRDDRLVLIGGEGAAEAAVRDAIDRLGLAGRVLRPGRVSAAERDALMAAADLMVFPSEEEGFGAPVVEAMALGTPVVCSDIPALAEVSGGATVLAGHEPDAIAAGMRTALERTEELIALGRWRATAFSPEAAGSALATAYRRATGGT
jgi:alpha-1,3-rhamnosyl/mannosyltransferase